IQLSKPRQDLMIFYKGTLNVNRPQFYVSQSLLRRQLQDIFDHGFRSITIDEYHPYLQRMVIEICEEIGFDGHLVLLSPHFMERLNCRKLTPALYTSDELDLHIAAEPDAVVYHRRNHQLAKEQGIKTMASVFNSHFSEFFDDEKIGGAPDAV